MAMRTTLRSWIIIEVRAVSKPAIHPGEFLSEILEELDISQAAFAKAIGVSAMRISHVVKGKRPVTAELALRLGRVLGQSPEYWLNSQRAYDLAAAQEAIGREIKTLRPLPKVA
jgi:addiction module HigA family antidote